MEFNKNPSNGEILISNPTSPQIEVNLPEDKGIYSFSLKVTDSQGNSSYNAVNVNNGVKWVYSTNGSIYSSPAIGNDGNIYFGNSNNNFYSINPNGTLNWTFVTNGKIYSSPAIANDGTIYINDRDNNLYSISPQGLKKWELKISNSDNFNNFLSVGNDGTIFLSNSGQIVAVNPDGTKKWENFTNGGLNSSPVIGIDGLVISNSTYGGLLAFLYDGNLKWTQNTKQNVWGNPSAAIDFFGNIYIGSADILFAINPNGTKKWEFNSITYIKTAPSIGNDGTVYFGVGNAEYAIGYFLYAITPEGTEKWKFSTKGEINSIPLIGEDGTIYFGSNDKNFYALNPDGTLKWKFLTNEPIASSPTIQNDGTIYFGCTDGILYAISTNSKGLADSPWPKANKDIRNSGNAVNAVNKINYHVSLPNCENSDDPIEIFSGNIYEGNKIEFPEYTLPSELSVFQNFYNFLTGLEIIFPVGSLKENITLNLNLNLFCETGIGDNPTTDEIIELLSMYIQVIRDTSGVHDLSDYYYLKDKFEAAIKIPLANIKNLLGLTEINNANLLSYLNKNENGFDLEGMRSEVDSLFFTIYTNQLSSINLDYKLNLTDIADINKIPEEYALYQNYPNPFNPSTKIKYSIPINEKSETRNVKLIVYDVLGKEIETLVNETKSPGNYEVTFDASNLSSGIYFYRIQCSDFTETKKMFFIK
ncbi:MAG: PQQ-binding-like beta-propeller repeat protein [Ignavibacteriae bacterium]|nr:PQQ-binding-like beta-propeller repeat protein [Ignavibacteriota bacterium]